MSRAPLDRDIKVISSSNARQIGVYLEQVQHTHTYCINHFRHNKLNINLKILKSTFGKVGAVAHLLSA